MKIRKAVLAKQPINAAERIDALGNTYQAAKEEENGAAARAKKASDAIKALAEAHGAKSGNETLVVGTHYVGGYVKCEDSKTVDLELARRVLSPAIFRQCLSEAIDENKLIDLVNQKKITAAELQAITVVSRQGAQRLVLRQI